MINKLLTYSVKTIALLIFVSLIPILFLFENSTYLVWTVIIPLVPILFISLGYSNWRKVCPLAFFSILSQKVKIKKKRKVPEWFENNLYAFQFTLLTVAFSARLVLLNFDAYFLGLFFVLLVFSSFLANFVYTGKTWCNFFCPVGMVEKIYSGSNAENNDTNSKCSACSGCKINCPDIDMENNYWKENGNPQQSFAFYSFSGLVLGFYLYFYLQTGSFSYYFNGEWSLEYSSMLSQGFFFAPSIPLIIAAPLTLVAFSLVSYLLFKSLEVYLWKNKVFKNVNYQTLKHRVRITAGFVAFNIFYAFAGAPAFVHYPMFYAFFHFFVVVISALILHKEFFRKDTEYVVDRFTLKMIKKLDPSKKQTHSEKLRIYKESLSELFEDGIVDHESAETLEELRSKVDIPYADHNNTIRGIQLQNATLFDTSVQHSPERRYQISSYESMIENALEQHQQLDQGILDSLQDQFCISNEDHKTIMDKILNSNTKLKSDVLDLINSMKTIISIHNSIVEDNTREINFLKYSLRKEFNHFSKDLFILLDIIYEDFHKNIAMFKKALRYAETDESVKCDGTTLSFMDKEISSALLELNKELLKEVSNIQQNNNIDAIKNLINNESLTLSTIALLCLQNYPKKEYENIDYDKFLSSKDKDVIAVANKIINQSDVMTTYDKMLYIHHVPIFSTIKFDDLYRLSNSVTAVNFNAGDDIITQGDFGSSLFILTSGEVDVLIDNNMINRLLPGEHFGAVAIIADTLRTATVRAFTDCVTLKLSKEDFKRIIYDNPKISLKIMKEITTRLLENNNIGKK